MNNNIARIVLFVVFFSICAVTYGQDGAYGAYSPYSIYGIGDISKEGTAFNKSMGGVGVATRNRRFINYLNPAAITARDTLAFMADFGVSQKNTVYRQGDMKSGNNTFNIYNLIFSFPIWRSSAMVVGITPYSDVGYDFSTIETDPNIIANAGNISYNSFGKGSVYQLFVGAGATFWKRLSVGAEFIYYFGNIDKVTNTDFLNNSYRSLNSGSDLTLRGATGKFGLQYEQKLGGNVSMIVGATYKLRSKMKGYSTNYRYATQSSVTDTISHNIDTLSRANVRFSDELGVGIAVKGGERWSVEFDYLRSDWRNCGMDNTQGFSAVGSGAVFSSTVSHSFRAGFEIIPNRNDIRYYFRRCAYRAGVYYDKSYFKLDGNNVNAMGLTLGITLPVFRWYNGISLGVDFGQRSSTRNNMIRERYVMFNIGFNIHDIWFQKPRYN